MKQKTIIETITHSHIIMGDGRQSDSVDKIWKCLDEKLNKLREKKEVFEILSTTAVSFGSYLSVSATVEMSVEDKTESPYQNLR